MQCIIHVYYRDVGEQGPRGGCGYQSIQREVKDISEIEGGLRGTVKYRGKEVSVYRKKEQLGGEIWESRHSCLGPIKVTRVFGGSR